MEELKREVQKAKEEFQNQRRPLYGGIEAGGTKFVCVIGTGPDDLKAVVSFPTTTPAETLSHAIEFFKEHLYEQKLAAIGIASFGPIDLNPSSFTFGYIASTPKPEWTNIDIVGIIKSVFNVPVGFDTDVNGAALAEHRFGCARDIDNFIYLTVGTGVGGGGLINGKLIHGLLHPEMGHIRIPHDRENDPFPGICPYHNDCFEGLASGPAIYNRWGKPAEELPDEHPAWALEAHYIALALTSYICVLSPELIILGGGVMERSFMLPLIRDEVQELLNNYINNPKITKNIVSYIVKPELGKFAGVLGAIVLAEEKYKSNNF